MARTGSSNSKISIWWDIENCHVPRNVDPHYIAQNLRSALHHADLNGPITIDVFGDTRNLDHKTLEALSSTGVTINHIPSGNKDAADKAILVSMLFWALDNAPPAHFLLISGDGDFANALHRLRFKGYDILLARPDQPVKPALLGAATSVWYWTSVSKGQIPAPGDDLSGRYSSNKMGNGDFHKDDPYNQKSLPKVVSQHTALLSRASNVSTTEVVQSLNQRTAPLQESQRSRKCLRDMSPSGVSRSSVSDHGSNTSLPHEDMRRYDEEADKLESSKQPPWNLGHRQPMRSADERADLLKLSRDKLGTTVVSSNKIADHMQPASSTFMPTLAERLPSLSQDAYNSIILKVMKSFERLKLDGLLPTQENLHDCLSYWDKQRGQVILKEVLDDAVHLRHIQKVSAGGGGASTYFLPPNTQLWEFFDVADMTYAFSDVLWNEFHQFLCSSKNWQFFVHSQSMYEAAQRLKSNGHSKITDLALGKIILLLNQAIQTRNWLSLETTPTFLLSIKSPVVIEQNPSNGFLSSLSRVSKDTSMMTASSCTQGGAQGSSLYHRPTNLLILETLRFWLMEISRTRSDYDVSLVPKDFQQATGIQLEIKKLGFARLQDLIEHFHDVVTIKVVRKGLKVLCPAVKMNRQPTLEVSHVTQQIANHRTSTRVGVSGKETPQRAQCPPSILQTPPNTGGSQDFLVKAAAQNHPILKKLRKWLLQLPSLKDGYDLSFIKREFLEATGIVLDPPSLGYSKIKDIIKIFPKDFCVESPRQGLSLIYATKKGMPAVKSILECKPEHFARQSSGHGVGEEGISKEALKDAANCRSSMRKWELHSTGTVNDEENSEREEKAIVATIGIMTATNGVQY